MSGARRPRLTVGLAAVLAIPALLLGAALPATAATTRPFQGALDGFQKPDAVAVDETTGDVYVLDAGAETVSRFDSTLQPAEFPALGGNVIDGKAPLECETLCDGTPANGFAFNGSGQDQLAVDNSGNPLTEGDLYVVDPRHRVVDVFASSGTYLGQLTATGASGPRLGEPGGVAIDPNGGVHVSDPARNQIDGYVPTANPPTDGDFSSSIAFTASRIAAGAATTAGDLFGITAWGGVEEVEPEGGSQVIATSGQGVAVDSASGHPFVSAPGEVTEYDATAPGGDTEVDSFGQMQLETPEGIAVDAAASRVYVVDAATEDVDVYGPPAQVAVPGVVTGPVTPLPNGRETLTGFVDARDVPTRYYFEYGAADCALASCASAPTDQEAALGRGVGPIRIAQDLSALRPGTTYHYRLVAVNAGGTARSTDQTFTTAAASPPERCSNAAIRAAQGLPSTFPDCRAFELVSAFPATERNNVDVFVNTQRVQAATSGDAFEFSTQGGAGDVRGTGVVTSYVAARAPGAGWVPHGINPPQTSLRGFALLFAGEAGYLGTFTPSLSKGVFTSVSPVNAEGPNVSELRNLYLREDLLQPGPGSYRLLSDAVTPQALSPGAETSFPPKMAGASTDLSHIFFETSQVLTGDPGLGTGNRLYEWVDGEVRLISVLPASEGGEPTLGESGQGFGSFDSQAVSANGSRVLFTSYESEPPPKAGRLYLRDDHGTADSVDDTTIKVSGDQPATFWAASADLSQVFFTSTEALTDDAPTDEPTTEKLYRYDLDAPAGSHLTLLSVDRDPEDGIEDGVEGVIGASADGSYVYFIASNQLVPGMPVGGGPRIFVWHEGQVDEVAPLADHAEAESVLGQPQWGVDKAARISPDGRHLAFVAGPDSELTGSGQASTCPAASTSCRQVYLYSSAGGEEQLRCASCREDASVGSGGADFNYDKRTGLFAGVIEGSPYLNHALSADGRHLFFTSEEPLSPDDHNEDADVYELDTATGMVRLLSGAEPGKSSYFLDASEDGKDVFFATRSSLLESDGNQSIDVYDARVEGGFEEAAAPALASCQSTPGCRPGVAASATEGLAAQPPAKIGGHPHRKRRRAKRHHRAKHRHSKRHRGKGTKPGKAGRGDRKHDDG